MTTPSAPLCLTMGDAAGIGPEIIVQAYQHHPGELRACFVAGDMDAMRRAAAVCSRPGSPPWPIVQLDAPIDVFSVPPRCIPVLQIGAPLPPVPWGRLSAPAGEFAGRCVVWAADAALRGDVRAMVTAPLHKEALHAAGAPYEQYPGHTEILQARAAHYLGRRVADLPVRMMLANDELRTVLLSIHMPLRDAIAAVTHEQIVQTLLITHQSLSRLLGRPPRMAVAGLNPHAGEGGLFGREEIDIIAPAIRAAGELGCLASGPWAPDTIFMRARHTPDQPREFDVVIAMYHDQGLIPVKYHGVDKGVNVTLGLPLVRTSPDHGTAFDIAGTGRADASSLVESVRMARVLSANSDA